MIERMLKRLCLRNPARSLVLLVCASVLGGCSTIDLDESIPLVFDLNGEWTLNQGLSELLPHEQKALEQAAIKAKNTVAGSSTTSRSRRRQGGAMAFVDHDFPVLAAREMKIEQNADSMGISYDRGNYRDVSWGYRERGLWEIHAGWSEEGYLVIYSETRGAQVKETYSLEEGRNRLVVVIDVDVEDQRNFEVTRVYDRT
jgi:hypothetical protein